MLKTAVAHKQTVKTVFLVLSIALFVFAVAGAQLIIAGNPAEDLFYQLSRPAGQASLVLFIITILPGIARRFGIRNDATAIIMLFRRQLGILTFLLGLTHYFFIFLAPTIRSGVIPTNPPLFQIMGVLSLYPMALLFLTSNDWAVRHMGKWWNRLHALVYIIAWTIFLHVALVKISVWTVLIGVAAVAETASLIYTAVNKKPSAKV